MAAVMGISNAVAIGWIAKESTDDKLTIVCNGLEQSDDKPLAEPMLTQIYLAIWRHWATMD